MEHQVNPYESGGDQQIHNDPSASMPVSAGALSALLDTKFWVTLVGIVMMIGVVIQLVVTIFIGSNIEGVESTPLPLIAVQLVIAVIYFILALRLLQYGKAIGRLTGVTGESEFEKAMDVQSKFWRLLGILCIVTMALMVLTMIISAMYVNTVSSEFNRL